MITVDLSHAPNPDIKGGYWTTPINAANLILHDERCIVG